MTVCVLLVEDDAASRFMMTEMLDELGAYSVSANDGIECLAALEVDSARFDAVLLDLHMPNMSGIEAVGRIRRHPFPPTREIKVFAVTADPSWHDKDRATAAGFNGVVEKPVSLAVIRALLDELEAARK